MGTSIFIQMETRIPYKLAIGNYKPVISCLANLIKSNLCRNLLSSSSSSLFKYHVSVFVSLSHPVLPQEYITLDVAITTAQTTHTETRRDATIDRLTDR